jgi:thiol peroxidase
MIARPATPSAANIDLRSHQLGSLAMAQTALGGNPVHTVGDLPAVGSSPSFSVTRADLSEATNADYAGKRVIVNIFPSIDTPTCATSVRTFNQRAAGLDDTVVLCVSADLPFAQKRFCGAEGIENVETASTFRSDFGQSWGVELADGRLNGLLARAVVVLDEQGKVAYTELVPDIANEPDYDAAIAALG